MPDRYARIRAELAHAESADPPTALSHLRVVLEEVSYLLDEQLAHAIVDGELSLRSAGAKAGLTENAVGPRLARTPMLAPYARPDGRVTAKEVQLARYERKRGGTSATPSTAPKPLRFKPRRNT
ncbi:hypothetical protein [Rhodococcus spongiicola]|uniref:Uncharacterized protein n=1 Tax=Rhodococcus spongiicola TaxID=2487352 RepID=A0A3S3ALR2_9NOCA|nr:hypothetical protein [Rhodococcus spongiicola]RVW03661.1 hypothetical protein EF834_11310 [Rhodococcus spongiicola]